MRPLLLIVAALVLWLAGPAQAQPAMQDMVLGKEDAPVTIIEYASLTCPHCASFHEQTLPKLKAEYIDTGKVKLIYRDFPFDEPALRAAQLARCARPERYFGFIDVLFRQQRQWATQNWLENLKQIARLGGIPEAQFMACLQNKELEEYILKTRLQGQNEFRVDSTPSFIIDGKKLAGARSFEELKSLIDPLVAKAK